MENSNRRPIPWALFVSEQIGTALLVLIGLSLVTLMSEPGKWCNLLCPILNGAGANPALLIGGVDDPQPTSPVRPSG